MSIASNKGGDDEKGKKIMVKHADDVIRDTKEDLVTFEMKMVDDKVAAC